MKNVVFTNLDGGFGDTIRNTVAANAPAPGFCRRRCKWLRHRSKVAAARTALNIRAGYDIQQGNIVYGVVFGQR
jgi:hypothetical protein